MLVRFRKTKGMKNVPNADSLALQPAGGFIDFHRIEKLDEFGSHNSAKRRKYTKVKLIV